MIIRILCSLVLILRVALCIGQHPVINGTIDLSDHLSDQDQVIELSGAWSFAKGQLSYGVLPQSDIVLTDLPGVWNSEDQNGYGYGSYHIQVILPAESRHYALEIPYMYTAFKVYVDSILVAHNGQVGTNPTDHISQFKPVVAGFYAQDTIHLTIQVSNYEDRKGGIWSAPKIGLSQSVMSTWTLRLAMNAFIIGALFIIGFYQMMLFIMRQEDRSTLYFGLFCIGLSLRGLCVGHVLINYIAPQFSWLTTARIEYISMFALSPLFILFIDQLFEGYIGSWVKKAWVSITALIILFILVTPKVVFAHSLYILVGAALISLLLVFTVMICAYKDGRKGALNAIVGTGIFAMATINDILYGFELIDTGNMLEYGLLAFIIIQALNIAYIFGKAFEDVKKLTQDLQLTNLSYSRFVPSQFLSFLGKEDITKVELGDQRRADIAILFVDIRSFTALSETMTPQENFDFINSYFKRISPVITANGGFVDKFIGDAIMSLFPNSVEDCINAALGMHEVLIEYNQKRSHMGKAPIAIGIGLHVGSVMLGTVGEPQRMDTTVISDAVNLASRLEGLAKHYNTPILTTQSTLSRLNDIDQYQHRTLHIGQVKGRTELVTLVEIISTQTDPLAKQKIAIKASYESAIKDYQNERYAWALKSFEEVAQLLSDDVATKAYIGHCKERL